MSLEIFCLSDGAAVITGAAGGIGREISIGIAGLGTPVACLDREGQALSALVDEIMALGRAAVAVPCDVSDETSINDAVAQAERDLGRLAYGVNAAGINIAAPALDLKVEDWESVMRVNSTGLFLSCRAQARSMLAHGAGAIVNIASMSASIINRQQHQSAYYASKAAVKHITAALAAEWAPSGVRVNAISPGYTATPMLRASTETIDGFRFMTPMARLAKPAEMVGPTIFLLSQASSFVTGQDIKVDGGYSIW